MYSNAENLAGRNFDEEIRAMAEVTLSQYNSITKLKEAEEDWLANPILA
jgi:hypothetical protein